MTDWSYHVIPTTLGPDYFRIGKLKANVIRIQRLHVADNGRILRHGFTDLTEGEFKALVEHIDRQGMSCKQFLEIIKQQGGTIDRSTNCI